MWGIACCSRNSMRNNARNIELEYIPDVRDESVSQMMILLMSPSEGKYETIDAKKWNLAELTNGNFR
jgi:hypothetical protein